jgi:transcriptional regulator with XRE-family HTH domain
MNKTRRKGRAVSENDTDVRLIERFLRGTAELTQAEAAAAAGIGQPTLSRWRGGDRSPLRGATRRALEQYLARRERAEAEAGEWRDRAEAEDLFSSLDAVARFLGGIAPPGQEKARKLDALEGYRRMITAREVLPSWWYQLKERVENESL